MTSLDSVRALDAQALTRRLAEVLLRERSCVVESVCLLLEMRRREVHLALGFDSLFTYCVEVLGLERSGAYRRCCAAELLDRYPAFLPPFLDGRIRLSALVPLRKILTADNHLAILQQALGLSEEQAARLVAEHLARPIPRDVVRRLPARTLPATSEVTAPTSRSPTVEDGVVGGPLEADSRSRSVAGSRLTPAAPGDDVLVLPPPRPRLEPLPSQWTRIAFSASSDFVADLARAKSAFSHVVPDGSLEGVLHHCLRLALETAKRRKVGSSSGARKRSAPSEGHGAAADELGVLPPSPRAAPSSSAAASNLAGPAGFGPKPPAAPRGSDERVAAEGKVPPAASFGPKLEPGLAQAVLVFEGEAVPESGPGDRAAPAGRLRAQDGAGETRTRYIPVEVRQAVWERDEERCSHVSPTGRRCGSTHQLEFDHREPFALGGPSSVANVRVFCRPHNQAHARAVIGSEVIARAASRDHR